MHVLGFRRLFQQNSRQFFEHLHCHELDRERVLVLPRFFFGERNEGACTTENLVSQTQRICSSDLCFVGRPSPSTTTRHLSPWSSSAYLFFLCLIGLVTPHCRGSVNLVACRVGAPECDVDSELRTMMERPDARTSISRYSVAATSTFISLNLALHFTVARASLHTLAKVFSGASALLLSLPERGHAALCLSRLSSSTPHPQLAFTTDSGRRNLSNNRS